MKYEHGKRIVRRNYRGTIVTAIAISAWVLFWVLVVVNGMTEWILIR